MSKKKILVIGGAGYIGTELCNSLYTKYDITCLDTFWFGNFLNKKIKKIRCDIKNLKKINFNKFHTVIHLAYLSNDPLCELNPKETWETGPLALYNLLEKCKKAKVKKFIFASSGSIYGIKKERHVTEKLRMEPLTDYNKSKMICEKVLESYRNFFKLIILRPATVCGFSKRLRLDVVINLLCYQAYYKKKILVLGGDQVRPILHLKDMIRAYDFCIKKNITGIYNVGFENIKVKNLANEISKKLKCKILFKKSNDPRSYRMNSDKIKKLGFYPKFNYKDSINDLLREFEKGFKPSLNNFNLNYLTKKKLVEKIK